MANNLTLHALLNIGKKYSHEEMARIIGEALNLAFEEDYSGRWDTYRDIYGRPGTYRHISGHPTFEPAPLYR